MAVQDTTLDDMTAEELLAALARPDLSQLQRERLRERIVHMHSRLAMKVAGRYRNRGEPLEDLLQAAYVGLMKAIKGYDPKLGHDFRGYAVVTMIGEVKRHFRDRTWAVRVPRLYQERRAELNRLIIDLSQTLQRSPTVAELAAHMRLTEGDILLTLDAATAYSAFSLDAPFTSDENTCLGDLIPDQDDTLDILIDTQAVKPLVDALSPRDKSILLLRFYGNLTQAEIAAEFGISQMHVSRILRNILDRLRAGLCEESPIANRRST